MCTPYEPVLLFFFFNDTATTEISTLSLHDALPISRRLPAAARGERPADRDPHRRRLGGRTHPRAEHRCRRLRDEAVFGRDRKSTRLNSSHSQISYAVFCLKKKKTKNTHRAHVHCAH